MAKRGSLAATVAALALLGLGAAGCGSDDSGSSATSPPADGGAQANETSGGRSAGGDGDGSAGTPPAQGDGGAGEGEAGDAPSADRGSPGGAEEFVTPGGDNSVQEFGEEADETELEEAAAALHAFLDARAEGDWETTCAHLSANVLESLGRFASQDKQLPDTACPALLAGVSGPATEDARREAAIAEVGAMRVEGERAYLLYHGAAKTDYAIPMAREEDGWKVDALGGVPLS